MEHIVTTKSNIKKLLVKDLRITIKEQHCSVNAVFLCEYSHTKYYK